MQGSIPYVPFLRAPFYCWVGHVPQLASVLCENKVEAPPHFPPTFLYTMSWEDPRPDAEVSTWALSHCRTVSDKDRDSAAPIIAVWLWGTPTGFYHHVMHPAAC